MADFGKLDKTLFGSIPLIVYADSAKEFGKLNISLFGSIPIVIGQEIAPTELNTVVISDENRILIKQLEAVPTSEAVVFTDRISIESIKINVSSVDKTVVADAVINTLINPLVLSVVDYSATLSTTSNVGQFRIDPLRLSIVGGISGTVDANTKLALTPIFINVAAASVAGVDARNVRLAQLTVSSTDASVLTDVVITVRLAQLEVFTIDGTTVVLSESLSSKLEQLEVSSVENVNAVDLCNILPDITDLFVSGVESSVLTVADIPYAEIDRRYNRFMACYRRRRA